MNNDRSQPAAVVGSANSGRGKRSLSAEVQPRPRRRAEGPEARTSAGISC